jgi:hypothetical protein
MSSQDQIRTELFQWLGKMTANFSTLEGFTQIFLASLISDDPVIGRTVTADLGLRSMIPVLRSLYQYRVKDKKKIDRLRALLVKIHSLEEDRNRMVHSKWALDPAINQMVRSKATVRSKKGFEVEAQVVHHAQLKRLSNQIAYAAMELDDIRLEWQASTRSAATQPAS